MNLTDRQTQAVDFVRTFSVEHRYGPSVLDVAEHLGVSQTAARRLLAALSGKKAIRQTPGIARSIRVCPPMA
jgi:SOS-response transcriptional repressor LexA